MKSPNRRSTREQWMPWVAGLLSLALMLWMLGTPPVQRTQEARVLEVAREMIGAPLIDWMIPRLDGEIRLQKPPLAYWLAAGAFEVGGISEGVGRIPFAIVGWLTLVLTYLTARKLFGMRVGLIAGAVLIGSLMFARHARLAETDILATLFVTAAIVCIWRGIPFRGQQIDRDLVWFALSGVMIGLAVMAKGPPALFVLGYLLAMVCVCREWTILWRWCKSGAPVLAVLVGLTWYIYAIEKVGVATFREETRIALMGEEHTGTVLNYLPDLLRAVAPWTALTVLALIVAIYFWRRDWRMREMLVWLGAILVPLFLIGQRQYHYLLPAMPPLAILTARLIDESLGRKRIKRDLASGLLLVTFIVILIGAVAILIAASKARPRLMRMDWATAALIAAAGIIGLIGFAKSKRSAVMIAIALNCVAVTFFTQCWLPSLQTDNSRTVATAVRKLAPGPVCFYGDNVSIPLMFYLQRLMPRYHSPESLATAARKDPDLVVLAQTKAAHAPPPLPAEFESIGKIESDEQVINLYRRKRSP